MKRMILAALLGCFMNGKRKNNPEEEVRGNGGEKGGRQRAKGETVVLFSLVWHYLSLLINPLRPCAWRSERGGVGLGERGGGQKEKCVCARVCVCSAYDTNAPLSQTHPCFTCCTCALSASAII